MGSVGKGERHGVSKDSRMHSPTNRWLCATLVIAALLGSAPAYAFRCGTRVITRGDVADKLLHFCGDPVSVQTRYGQRTLVGRFRVYSQEYTEEVRIEEWTYNLGPHQLMRLVRLENGVVADIKQLGYGY